MGRHRATSRRWWYVVLALLLGLHSWWWDSSSRGVAVVEGVRSKLYSPAQRLLIWKSNNAGLFSHYFQAKYMHHVAATYNRTLVLLPFRDSAHTTGELELLLLCNVFDMGPNMTCLRRVPVKKGDCFEDHGGFERENDELHVCFRGLVFPTTTPSFQERRMVLDAEPRVAFRNRYVLLFKQAEDVLMRRFMERQASTGAGLTNSNSGPAAAAQAAGSDEYMVVHWRRGDQLRTRCAADWGGLRDESMNCRSVDELMATILTTAARVYPGIRKLTDANIAIATNELNQTVLSTLRANGLVLVSDVIQQAFNASASPSASGVIPSQTVRLESTPKLHALEEFALEAQFMLGAASLITYGISTVNDVLEHARMQQGNKSWCLYIDVAAQNNWCQIFQGLVTE